ncbi:hypothetical protein F0U61_29205 [Archangium violaceum]|uniref:hypothetical protein n=1 Tax=Archangium violaceum TaxID=83451 RepID=UPI002B2C1E1D|nr:hypothetical protein F0U61_29205 [Archangium violaceum]
MAAKKKRQAGQGKPARQGTAAEAKAYRIPPLEFDPFTPGLEHPEWVRQEFPTYVEHQHESLARSVRTLEHQGRTISITTTYEVRVGERLITLHIMVDEEGQLWSHLCPYLTFASALELVRHLLTRMPHLFEEAPPGPSTDPDHSDHEHTHGGAR